jgi:large subunit ribosomal protein L18e
MTKSQNKIKKQRNKKTNPELVETINIARKNKNWIKIAEILSSSRRNRKDINLDDINKKTKEGDRVLVIGKVLSQGELDKKIKIVALSYSKKANEKLLKSKCEVVKILEEIKRNPEAKGLEILE